MFHDKREKSFVSCKNYVWFSKYSIIQIFNVCHFEDVQNKIITTPINEKKRGLKTVVGGSYSEKGWRNRSRKLHLHARFSAGRRKEETWGSFGSFRNITRASVNPLPLRMYYQAGFYLNIWKLTNLHKLLIRNRIGPKIVPWDTPYLITYRFLKVK